MLRISSVDDLVSKSMKILEPCLVDSDGNHREDVMHASEPVELVVLPGLAFDKSGGRLGRGGSYYDVFLKKYHNHAKERKWRQPLLVALSYSVQFIKEGNIPVTPYDISVDAVVSPTGFTPISPTAVERSNNNNIGLNSNTWRLP
ncbi:hypothetical protein K2173_022062 [Erythroxylum novogranatense]|uniref:5-formyltetrahydrofolate cyclo-ligase n=1 Tax=Erythroxylum novogranatense TaxID=1862640 RepID=A0AAV8T4H4_9ROSI|nr:hypothetical protein K2173_022062 [Erythroxylum novogranatense]